MCLSENINEKYAHPEVVETKQANGKGLVHSNPTHASDRNQTVFKKLG